MNQKELDNAFQFVVAAVKSASGNESSLVEFNQTKSHMELSAHYNAFDISFKIASKAEPWKSPITVDASLLPKAFKGDAKSEIELTTNQNTSVLFVKKKGFSASYNAVSMDFAKSDAVRKYTDVSSTLSVLATSIKALSSIKNLIDYSKYIRVMSDGKTIACGTGDNYHLTFVAEKKKAEVLDYCIPLELARLIATKDIETLGISTGHLKAEGPNVRIETNLVAPDKVIDLIKAKEIIQATEEAHFSINASDTLILLQNLNINAAKTVILSFFKDKKPTIAVKSPDFEAKAQLPGESRTCSFESIKIELNSKNFAECLSAFDKGSRVTFKALPNAISISSEDSRFNGLLVANKFDRSK